MALFLRQWSRAAVASPRRTHPRRNIRSVSSIAGGSSLPFRDNPSRRSGRRPSARGYKRDPAGLAALSHRRDFGRTATKRSRNQALLREASTSDPVSETSGGFAADHLLQEPSSSSSLSLQPWKILLEAPARASWRATDPRRDPPEHLKAAMYRILDEGDRTSKQLRRAHRKVLSIQSDLADLRERERRTLVNGKRHFQQQQQQRSFIDNDIDPDTDEPDDARHYKNHRGHSSSSSSSVNPVYYGYDETLATLKHRLTPNYAITKRVLAECQSLLGGRMVPAPTATGSGDEGIDSEINSEINSDSNSDSNSEINSEINSNPRRRLVYSRNWKPRRVLDFGIGCGSASAAAIDLFGSDDNDGSSGIEWIHGIDPSQPMRECSKKLIEEMTRGHQQGGAADHASGMPPPTPRITFSTGLSPSSDDSSSSSSSLSGEGSFDLALLVYTASDLPDVSSCLAAAAMAFEKLKPNGVLVMIEPGTPDGFNSTRAVRNMLLDCCPPHDPEFEWEDRCHIVAPCTHNGSCPMERHKKNFFKHQKPIGKLGHDLPQELGGDGEPERAISIDDDEEEEEDDNDDDEDNDEDNDEDDEMDQVDSRDTLKMSETEAFNSSFCSFVHSVSGDSRRKGEKFSYLVAQKQRFRHRSSVEASTEGDPFRNDHVTNLLTDAMDAASFEADDLAARTFEAAQALSSRYVDSEHDDLGLELLQGEDKRHSMGRIVRAPIKKKGHVYIDYCAAPGRIIRSRVTKALASNAAPGLYGAARKSRWGGLWPDTMDRIFTAASRDTKPKP